jgi:hypothetical protein
MENMVLIHAFSSWGKVFLGGGEIILNDGVVRINELVFTLYVVVSCEGDEGIVLEHGLSWDENIAVSKLTESVYNEGKSEISRIGRTLTAVLWDYRTSGPDIQGNPGNN